MNKTDLRKEIRSKRKALDAYSRELFSTTICDKLLSILNDFNYQKIFCYLSTDNEVDTTELLNILLSNKKEVYVPKVTVPEKSKMVACKLPSTAHLIKGTYDILEPNTECTIYAETIDIAVVPGIAFTKKGYRLGFGKGYYDSFFNKISCIKIGLAYSLQLVDSINIDDHDIAMDYIITEKGIIKCR